MKHDLADLGRNGGTIEDFSGVVHCCTLSLCHLGSEIGYRVATPYSPTHYEGREIFHPSHLHHP